MPLSANIKKLRLLRKMSVKQLAEKMGVNRQTIYDWQSGDHQPSDDDVGRLAAILGVAKVTLYEDNPTFDEKPSDYSVSQVMQTERKYVERLEKDVAIFEDLIAHRDRVIQALLKKMKDAGLDTSGFEY